MKKSIITLFGWFLFTFIVGCNSLGNNQYTITFNSNGGSEVSAIRQDYKKQVTKPTDPTKTGYTFGGWYSDSNLTQEYTFTTMPKENITLYAKWTIKQYTITFNSNGGTEVLSITQDYNTQVTKPSDPTKTGYTFDGWYSDSDLTQEYMFTSMPKENIILYAKWLRFSSEGLKYTLLRDNTYSVSGYNGSDHNVIIPSFYKGRLVTAIYDYAFAGIKSSTSITIPSSVTKIGKYAFYEATGLSNINVDIDNPIFSSKDGVLLNKNQTTIIVYPQGKNNITYTIPNSITAIGDNAFLKAINLTSVIFEEGNQLTRIGDFAFSGATSLTSITIPDSVITIGNYAFSGATSLTSINVDDGNPEYSSKDGVLFDKYQTTIIVYPINKEEATYTIPNSVTTIGNSAFSRAINLTTVIFEEGSELTCIGLSAFYEATNLTSITIPKSVTTIGSYAFYETTNLTSIKIPSRVTYIGDSAFKGTKSLSSVIFEEGSKLTTIGSRAFSGTVSLTTVIFEEGSQLITIGDYAFEGARSLSSITIPKSITIIGNDVFLGATSLTSINVDVDNPVYSSIDGILFNKNQTLLIIYPESKNETIYTIPNSVTTIGDRAFSGATSLTSLTIPNSVTTIGDFAFKGATSLTNINVDVDNSQYSSVDGVLFNKNKTLLIIYPASKNETIYTIPNSVTIIGDLAFLGATSLTSITIPKSVTTIGNFVFYEATCLTTVIFEEGSQLTTIGMSVFRATSLTSIIIPDSVTTIGEGAFLDATSLISITIPNSVTTIKSNSFNGTTSLKSINVDDGNRAYSSKDGVLFDKHQTTIIFYPANKNEATYTIPHSVTTIEDNAFKGAKNLTSIIIPKSVTTIRSYAFYEATSLKTVIFEEESQLTTIGRRAFKGATSLTSITIPDSVTTIGEGAFEGVTSLTSIIITATTPPSLTDFGFETSNLKIYVPFDFVNLYKAAWTDYASIIYPIQ